MNERVICFAVHQTGNCTAAGWAFAFPFPTRLLGVKHSGTGSSKTSTFAIGGGATITATTISNGADPTYTAPDTEPDYVDAGTAYTLTLVSGTAIDDPTLILFFGVGEGGTNWSEMGDRVICVPVYQTGAATTAGWVLEFPFPTKYIGWYGCASATSTSTITLAGGAVDAAAAIGTSGTPLWATPTTEPDYCAADTAITVTLTQTATRGDDPMVLLFFAVGEGGANDNMLGEITQCVTLLQTGNCTAGDWVVEFPVATQLMGLKHSGSNSSKTSTIAVAGGATVTAATIGNGGDPTYTEADSTPDYGGADTAYTFTAAAGTAIDDPYILAFFQLGGGGEF